MNDAKPSLVVTENPSEAVEELVGLAGRKTLPIPPLMLAEHVMALPGPWDWPVRRAAFEAILRRLASAKTQELSVYARPRSGPFGGYFLGSPQLEGPLPYQVRLYGLSPLRARCDCMDFLRGALGLCKHVLTVVMTLAGSPRTWQRALASNPLPLPSLTWEPTSSPAGAFDPLTALVLDGARSGGNGTVLRRQFQPAQAGTARLAHTHGQQPGARLRLVRDLQRSILRARASADPAAIAVLAEERERLERVVRLAAGAAAEEPDADGAGAIEVENLVDAAAGSAPESAALVPAPASVPDGGAIAALMGTLKVEHGPDGALRIEAPPAAAGALASLFAGMARLLSAAVAPGVDGPSRTENPLPS